MFPRLPERTRLLRLFTTHHDWPQLFLAAPTVLGVIDTYGIELIHPMREGRSPQQIGRTLLLDSRVVELPMSSNPIVVTLSSLKPFFFNGLQ